MGPTNHPYLQRTGIDPFKRLQFVCSKPIDLPNPRCVVKWAYRPSQWLHISFNSLIFAMERVWPCKIASTTPLPAWICRERGGTTSLNPTILSACYNNPHGSVRKRIDPPNVHNSPKRSQIDH
jgi:hypothetical protein